LFLFFVFVLGLVGFSYQTVCSATWQCQQGSQGLGFCSNGQCKCNVPFVWDSSHHKCICNDSSKTFQWISLGATCLNHATGECFTTDQCHWPQTCQNVGTFPTNPGTCIGPAPTPAPTQSRCANKIEMTFEVKWKHMAIDGYSRPVLTINDQFPGPNIWAKEGDLLIVNVVNMARGTAFSLHWHGIEQIGTPFMDGSSSISQCEINEHQSFRYEFRLNKGGTYWYHIHHQFADGAYGGLIVKEANNPYTSMYDEELVVIVSDYYHNTVQNMLIAEDSFYAPSDFPPGPFAGLPLFEFIEPPTTLINGMGVFNCSEQCSTNTRVCNQLDVNSASSHARINIVPGKRYRLHLINAAASGGYSISIDGHPLTIIETDGSWTLPYTVNGINANAFGNAQRYSVIFTANQSASNYWIRATSQFDDFPFPLFFGQKVPQAKAILHYNSTTLAIPTTSEFTTNILTEETVLQGYTTNIPAATMSIRIDIEIQFLPKFEFKINGTTFEHPSTPVLLGGTLAPGLFSTIPKGSVVDIILHPEFGSHPIHLHGHQFWILAKEPAASFSLNASIPNFTNFQRPIKRDVVMTAPDGFTKIRFVADHAGAFLLHCHIADHHNNGFAFVFRVAPNEWPGLIPSNFPRCGDFALSNSCA